MEEGKRQFVDVLGPPITVDDVMGTQLHSGSIILTVTFFPSRVDISDAAAAAATATAGPLVIRLGSNSSAPRTLSSSSIDAATVEVVVEVDWSGGSLQTLKPTLFENVTTASIVRLNSNKIIHLLGEPFAALSAVENLFLQFNVLTALPERVFVATPALVRLNLHGNEISELPAQVFHGLSALKDLLIGSNVLRAIPELLFRDTTRLQYLGLSNNLLTTLPSGSLGGLSRLVGLFLNGNKVHHLPARIFSDLRRLSILRLQNNSLTSLGDTSVTQDLTNVASVSLQWNQLSRIADDALAQLSLIPSLALSPNPLQCNRSVAGTIVCFGCVYGFVFDPATRTCAFPSFGPAATFNVSTEPSPFGDDGADAAVLFAGVSYAQDAPNLLPKSEKFLGYSSRRFDQIQYRLDHEAIPLNMSCNKVVFGTTRGAPNLLYTPNVFYDEANPFFGPEVLYGGGEARYTFEIGNGGANVTFDTCLSEFFTGLAVYRVSSNGSAATVVYPRTPRTLVTGTITFVNGTVSDAATTAIFPHDGGCGGLSLNARIVNLSLGAGVHYVVVESGAVEDITSPGYGGETEGDYVLKMECSTPNQTVLPIEERLGLQVDASTGAVGGTPRTPGNYSFNLSAVDVLSGSVSTIRAWSVVVVENQFRLREGVTFELEPPLPSVLALNWTHRFKPRPVANSSDFVGTDFFVDFAEAVFFRLDVTPLDGSVIPETDILSRSSSALIQVIPSTEFAAQLALIAVDSAGNQIVLVNTTVLALPADSTWIDIYGPGGQGCNGGEPIQLVGQFSNNHSCDCTALQMTGLNCDFAIASAGSGGSSSKEQRTTTAVVASISVTLVIVAVVLLVVMQRRLNKARNQPEDFDRLQARLMADLGVGSHYDIGEDEVGLELVLESISPAAPHEVLDSLRKSCARNIRSVGAIAVKWETANFYFAPETDGTKVHCVLLRPPRIESDDKVLAAIMKPLSKGRLFAVDIQVVDASLRIPRRVPREIPRSSFTRHDQIGDGTYSSVYKADVRDHPNLPNYLVAAETLQMDALSGEAGDFDDRRDCLLMEAGLQSMLVHPNIVTLIGVITIPTTVPPFILFEYCERGSLHEYVRQPDVSIETELLLSLLGDVAAAMDFLGANMVVHRNLCARSVLLDHTLTAKVSDFRLARALGHRTGETPLSTYMSNTGTETSRVLVRWAAIEVLESGDFSLKSDVWAFGMLCFEAFAKAIPFASIEDDATVWNNIVEGSRPSCPGGCPQRVHDMLMLPCWNVNPVDRPKFSHLLWTLVQFGSDGSSNSNLHPDFQRSTEWDRLQQVHEPSYFETVEGQKFLGISIHHMMFTFQPAVSRACAPPYRNRNGVHINPAAATIGDAVSAYAKPQGALLTSAVDGMPGCAYVSTLSGPDHVGPSTALLSYSWSYQVHDVVQALAEWSVKNQRDVRKTYVWICALCLNQHRIVERISPQELASVFSQRVERIGRIVPLLSTWKGKEYVSRAWCLFELFTAIQNHEVAIDIILPPVQKRAFIDAIHEGGYETIDSVLHSIKSEEAEATVQNDLLAIKALVEALPGQYATLNRTVRTHLQAWFEESGVVHTSSRLQGSALSWIDSPDTLSSTHALPKSSTLSTAASARPRRPTGTMHSTTSATHAKRSQSVRLPASVIQNLIGSNDVEMTDDDGGESARRPSRSATLGHSPSRNLSRSRRYRAAPVSELHEAHSTVVQSVAKAFNELRVMFGQKNDSASAIHRNDPDGILIYDQHDDETPGMRLPHQPDSALSDVEVLSNVEHRPREIDSDMDDADSVPHIRLSRSNTVNPVAVSEESPRAWRQSQF